VADVAGNIQGALNQANLASRLSNAERSKARKGEEDRIRDARQRFITTQEEVSQAQTLHGRRIESEKEQSDGQDARDQYDAHSDMLARRAEHPPKVEDDAGDDASGGRTKPPEADSGNLIDIEA
jgi:hypothetical protein